MEHSGMKPKIGLFVFTLTLLSACAPAFSQTCQDHQILPIYEDVKAQQLQALEGLSEADKAVLENVYSTGKNVAVEYAQHKVGSPVPTSIVMNLPNFKKIVEGDNLGGSLGIYSNVIGEISPTLGDKLADMWRDSLAALAGQGKTVAEHEDENNRKIVSRQLQHDGCSGELSLPPYRSPQPPTPLYYGKADMCDEAYYQNAFRQGTPDVETFDGSGFTGDEAACHYTGGAYKYQPSGTPYYIIWSSRVELAAHVLSSDESALEKYEEYVAALGCESRVDPSGRLSCAWSQPDSSVHFLVTVHKNALLIASGSFLKDDAAIDKSSLLVPLTTHTLDSLKAN